MKTKYAIKLMLSADDWIYVTEDTEAPMFHIHPVLFDSRQAAEKHAEIWNKRFTKVVRWREK